MRRNRRQSPKAAASPEESVDERQDAAPAGDAQGGNEIRAGEALLRAAAENPEAYPGVFRMLRLKQYMLENPEFAEAVGAIWEPVRQANEAVRLVTAKVVGPLRPVMTAICAEYSAQLAAIQADIRQVQKDEFEKLLDEIRKAEAEADREWASSLPCPRPKTVEQWQSLAVRAGLPADFSLRGEWTPKDILPIVEGYFQRMQDQGLLRADNSADTSATETAEAPAADGSPFYKPAHFKQYNIGDELLRRNATSGKRYVPGKVRRINKQTRRGKRGFYWYSEPDARACWPHRFSDAEGNSS